MNKKARNLVFASLCTAIGLLLPSFFHMFGWPGSVFLPMHIPVLICGFLCGWQYGGLCGILVPLLTSILTGMPPLFPIGATMILELGTYGVLTGILYKRTNVYTSLIGAMIGGRIINGFANTILLGFSGIPYSFETFLTGAFVTALPGIIIQLIIIPLLIVALKKAGYIEVEKLVVKHWGDL